MGNGTAPHRYALNLTATLPSDLPHEGGYPFATRDADGWYAVVAVTEDEALIEDVRRSAWPIPDGVMDWRRSP